MKFLYILFFLLLLGCSSGTPSNPSSSAKSIFNNGTAEIDSEVLVRYFDGDQDIVSILEDYKTDLNKSIESAIEKGRSLRGFDSKKLGPISIPYCKDVAQDRRRLAEIEFLLNFNEFNSWKEKRRKTQDIIETIPATIEQERSKLEKSVSDNPIARSLADLLAQDQSYNAIIHWKNLQNMDAPSKKYLRKLRGIEVCTFKLEAASTLKAILKETNGWPKISEYGEDADNAAFVVLHNLNHDLELLEYSLKKMEQLYPIGETKKWHYPNLYDVVANYNEQRQKYGWIIKCVDGEFKPYPELLDEAKVDEYRAEFDLPTLDKSIARFPKRCGQAIGK